MSDLPPIETAGLVRTLPFGLDNLSQIGIANYLLLAGNDIALYQERCREISILMMSAAVPTPRPEVLPPPPPSPRPKPHKAAHPERTAEVEKLIAGLRSLSRGLPEPAVRPGVPEILARRKAHRERGVRLRFRAAMRPETR